MGIRSRVRSHPRATVGTAFVVAAGLAFALYWFAPWDLFLNKKVSESLPTVAATPVVTESPVPYTASGASPPSTTPTVLAQEQFRSLEHSTSGRALILRLPDGSRYLRLEDLNTSNGPDLRVWITDQPASSDWHVWDDGTYVDLGALKGNIGDQNYLLPANVDLTKYRTAVVWCRRFKVGFGVAPLEPA